MRLNRFLASAGLGSRRSCEELIAGGHVSINGRFVTNLATKVGPDDDVRVDRRRVKSKPPSTILLHKPAGVVCTRSDESNRRTIYDLLPPHFRDLFHVGRLDKESEGLILLTNDGELSQALAHPSHQVDKEYVVTIDKPFDQQLLPKLTRGFMIEDGRARMESAFLLTPTKLKVVLRQGINRQIRKMLWKLGYDVKKLVRVRIGPLEEPEMKSGQYRLLTKEEIAGLKGRPK